MNFSVLANAKRKPSDNDDAVGELDVAGPGGGFPNKMQRRDGPAAEDELTSSGASGIRFTAHFEAFGTPVALTAAVWCSAQM